MSLLSKHRARFALDGALANSGWLLLDRLLRMALALLVGAWVARHLGPASYGELAYVLALLVLFQAGCALGLDGFVVREISQDPTRAPAILGSALRLRMIAGLVGWLAMTILAMVIRPEDATAHLMTAIVGAGLVFQSTEVVDLWLQSQARSVVSVAARALAYIASSLIKIGLILGNAPIWAFAATATAEMTFLAMALSWSYRRMPASEPWQWDWALARRMVGESWPFMVSALSIGIYMRIDQVVLRALAGERELGLYSAVLPFSQAWHMVPMTLCASLLPQFARLRVEDPEAYDRRLQQLFSLMAWLGIAAAAITAMLAPFIVRWLLGPSYADAVSVLQWHALTNVFVFLGVAQNLAIVSDRAASVALAKTLVGAAISLLMNFLLVPRWGAVGAAWAAGFSYCCAAVLSNAFVAPQAFAMQLRSFVPLYARRHQ